MNQLMKKYGDFIMDASTIVAACTVFGAVMYFGYQIFK